MPYFVGERRRRSVMSIEVLGLLIAASGVVILANLVDRRR
jgi:hypothetical protein